MNAWAIPETKTHANRRHGDAVSESQAAGTHRANDLVSSTENLWENGSRTYRLKEIYQPVAELFGF